MQKECPSPQNSGYIIIPITSQGNGAFVEDFQKGKVRLPGYWGMPGSEQAI